MGYGDNRNDGDRWQGREGGDRWERERGSYGDWGRDRERGSGGDWNRGGQGRGQRGGDNDRGFFERAGEQVRSWLGNDDNDRGGGGGGYGRNDPQSRDRGGASFGGGFGNQRGWGDDHFDRQYGSDQGGNWQQERGGGRHGSQQYSDQVGPAGGRSSFGGGGGGADSWGGSGFGGLDDNGRRFDRIDPGHVGAQGAHPMSSPVDGGYGGAGISAGGGAGSSAARYAAMGMMGERHIDKAKLLGDDRGGGQQNWQRGQQGQQGWSGGQQGGQQQPWGGSQQDWRAPQGGHQGGQQPWGGGGGAGGGQHDPHYSQWRQRQMEQLDRDYHEYCQEHQSKFEQDFGGWREKRQTQRQHVGRVTEHMVVVGSDGEHIGTVDKVSGDRIVLTKSDPNAGGVHHSIPCNWVESVDDKVTVNKSAAEAMRQWESEEQNRALFEKGDEGSEGPHMLNRSFSGTYEDRDS